jgi:hypothetical protein
MLENFIARVTEVLFGSAESYGHDIAQLEIMLMTSIILVISVLVFFILKLIHVWEQSKKEQIATTFLPVHGGYVNPWTEHNKKDQYGKLGTIIEDQIYLAEEKIK